MKHGLYAAFALILTVIFLQGCNTKTIRIDPIPELKTGSPLAGIEPLSFAFKEFEDFRTDKKHIGLCVNMGVKMELKDQNVSEIVRQAVVNELKRNGHKILLPGEANNADVVIEGIVSRFWIDGRANFATISYASTVVTDITVSTVGSDKPLSKTYEGNFNYSGGGFPGVLEYILNQALLDMLKEFTTDEDFLSRIKQVRNFKK